MSLPEFLDIPHTANQQQTSPPSPGGSWQRCFPQLHSAWGPHCPPIKTYQVAPTASDICYYFFYFTSSKTQRLSVGLHKPFLSEELLDMDDINDVCTLFRGDFRQASSPLIVH